MCISYVKLNSKTLNRYAYRLPRIADLLARVSSASVFSKLDLLSGFYQVRMRADDVAKTGFVTPYGNFEFKVMPMGLCGAPSTFQYLMDNVFRQPLMIGGTSLPAEALVAIYLDDSCVLSSSMQAHMLHIRAVLSRLREHKLYVKPTKCMWAQTEIDFLGHYISSQGMSANPERAKALQDWPTPTTLHELRSCLGTFNFWRQYIHRFSYLAEPLMALTRKGVRWRWRAEVEGAALQTLKAAVIASPVLASPILHLITLRPPILRLITNHAKNHASRDTYLHERHEQLRQHTSAADSCILSQRHSHLAPCMKRAPCNIPLATLTADHLPAILCYTS